MSPAQKGRTACVCSPDDNHISWMIAKYRHSAETDIDLNLQYG